ncbi:tyrosine-type recombinase/integrase [Raineyella fluvialis]|nr:site-specific integrase [Raineyella fluvialis]
MGDLARLDGHRSKPKLGGSNKRTRRRFGNIRKLPSGRFQASYQGPDGLRHKAPTTFLTTGDASKWLSLTEADIIAARWRPPQASAPTRENFRDYASRWLNAADLKPRTRDEYRRLIDDLVKTFGDRPLLGITPDEVVAWHVALPPDRATGNAHRYRMLHRVMQAAVDDENVHGLTVNPCQHPKWGKGPAGRPIVPATVGQLATIAEHMPPRLAAAVHVAAWCGLRLGELAELRRADVDLKGGTIRVTRSVQWVRDGVRDNGKARYVPVVGPPKSDAGIRTVTIPPHIVPILREHLAEHAQPGPRGLVFPAPEGGQLRSGPVCRVFGPAREAAGRPDLRWHDLRHTGATLYAQAGATLRESMAYLGHSTPGMALHYAHVAEGRPATLAAKLSAMAGWEPPGVNDGFTDEDGHEELSETDVDNT